MKHKNSQKRIYLENSVYFVTVCTKGRFPYFGLDYDPDLYNREGDTSSCRLRQDWKSYILSQAFLLELEFLKKMKNLKLHAWCLLPDHFHMMIQPEGDENISRIMKSFKENSSRDINRILNNSQWERDTAMCRLQIRTQLQKLQTQFHLQKHHNIPPFQWQKSFHDHIIRDERDYEKHWKYTTFNYLKHGLDEDWRWTSEKIFL